MGVMGRACALLSLASTVVLISGCGGDEQSPAGPTPAVNVEDPGPIHVHGLGINPKDGALFIATHTGLFRAAKGQARAQRVANRYQDTMGFTIVGPDTFLGSGHPDLRENLPAFLGLIRSEDAGRTWTPISLVGKRDFHVLEAAGRWVYGFGTDFGSREQSLLVSHDTGRSWKERRAPEPLISLATAAGKPNRVVASGPRGLYSSEDFGKRWGQLDGPPGLLSWTSQLVVIDARGAVHAAADVGGLLRPVGDVGGTPAALDTGPDGELYVALHDGTVKQSSDGRHWTVRSRP